jgi:grpE
MKKEQHNPELEKQNIADQDTQELENMLEQASKEAQEAEISPLIAKIAELEKALQEKEEIAKNSQIAYLHLKADFDILQRQTDQKIENANRDAKIKIVKKLIPQLENLRKSLLNLNDEQKEGTMGKGLLMMQEGFYKVLGEMGIEPIASMGLEPNPQFHEPVSMQLVNDEALKGKIVQEFEQGFVYKEGEEVIVLNPAKVVVGS